MEQEHQHRHQHLPENASLIFGLAVLLNFGFVVAEAFFGIMANSMALLADAGHNLSDILGLLLAWGAILLSKRRPTTRKTYGLRSATILAALINAIIVFVAVGGIATESASRLFHPEPVATNTVILVAAAGMIINALSALLFVRGRKKDLNLRAAFLHMAADAGVSAGVVAAGVGIILTGWLLIDPIVSLIIAAIILAGTWNLLKEALNLTFQGVPAGIDPKNVTDYLLGLPAISAVHDLHIWAMSTNETALTVHLIKPDPEDDDELLLKLRDELHDRFGVDHVTIQLERGKAVVLCKDGCVLKNSDMHSG